MQNTMFIDPLTVEMIIDAYDFVDGLADRHPVKRLLTEEYMWLGGVLEVREWFRLTLKTNDGLDASFRDGRLVETQALSPAELNDAWVAMRDIHPRDIIDGPGRHVDLYLLFNDALRAIRECATLPENLNADRPAASRRFFEIAALLIRAL